MTLLKMWVVAFGVLCCFGGVMGCFIGIGIIFLAYPDLQEKVQELIKNI